LEGHAALNGPQLLFTEDVAKSDDVEVALDVGQLLLEGWAFDQGNALKERLVAEGRSQEPGVPIVGRGPEQNLLTVNVVLVYLEHFWKDVS
jgi:hypothetical protein